jgi:hypothetical protein
MAVAGSRATTPLAEWLRGNHCALTRSRPMTLLRQCEGTDEAGQRDDRELWVASADQRDQRGSQRGAKERRVPEPVPVPEDDAAHQHHPEDPEHNPTRQ